MTKIIKGSVVKLRKDLCEQEKASNDRYDKVTSFELLDDVIVIILGIVSAYV